ncbi:MAG: bacillithiol system redox-active protein YtxJ [Acidobacteriaceae bacterium]|nr:bacillithiol system redox-active protein YtxJ [Acidobacteriaceae bacterium]
MATPPNLPEVTTVQEYDRLLGQDLTIVFKHSPTCPISLFAHREVMRFRTAQPEMPVYLVSVRRQREVARHIAERTGVRHESPQVLVLRRGNLVGAASHDEITAELLTHLTATA